MTMFWTSSVTILSLSSSLTTLWMSKCILSAMCFNILVDNWRSPPYIVWRADIWARSDDTVLILSPSLNLASKLCNHLDWHSAKEGERDSHSTCPLSRVEMKILPRFFGGPLILDQWLCRDVLFAYGLWRHKEIDVAGVKTSLTFIWIPSSNCCFFLLSS